MTMQNRFSKVLVLSVVLVLLQLPMAAQEEDVENSPVFNHFKELYGDSQLEAALAECDRIVSTHPGTEIAALALMNKAVVYDDQEQAELARSATEDVATNFPRTRLGYWAKLSLINMDHQNDSFEDWLLAVSPLLSELAVPSITLIAGGGAPSPTYTGSLSRRDYSLTVSEILALIASRYSAEPRKVEAVNVGTYLLNNFGSDLGDLKERQFSEFIVSDAADLACPEDPIGGSAEDDIQPPRLHLVEPADVENVPTDFLLKFEISDGDLRHESQVRISTAVLEIDGTVIPAPTFTTAVSIESVSLLYFQQSLLLNLSPGTHQGTLTVEDFAGNEAVLPFTLRVQSNASTTQTLPATRDALIDNFDPNGNEGANGILALDKLLGRSSRSLVAFDLSEVDTASLSKATLVLSLHKEERIFGCGPGEQVTVQGLTAPWAEGNGKTYKILRLQERRRGSGAGATWQRDIDTNIANFVANGGTPWSGALGAVLPPTAPLVMARDSMEGELRFDVTDDVLNGAQNGWLVRKLHENRASRISFYSKEGAAAKGDPDLAPRLVLEYGGSAAQVDSWGGGLAAFFGAGRGKPTLKAVGGRSENSGLREYFQKNSTAAFAGEQVVMNGLRTRPLLQLSARVAYRSWLRGHPSLV